MWWLSWFKRSSAACNPGPSVCGGKSECFSIMYSCFNLSLIIVLQPLSWLVFHTTKCMIPGRWDGLQSGLGITWGTGTQQENHQVSDKTSRLPALFKTLLWVIITVIMRKQCCLELGRKIRVDEVFLESMESTQLRQGCGDVPGSETRVWIFPTERCTLGHQGDANIQIHFIVLTHKRQWAWFSGKASFSKDAVAVGSTRMTVCFCV